MRKITTLFLLCALMLVSAISAHAQTAVDYQVSSAPTNGNFATDTHWFTMQLRGTYLSTEDVDDDGYIKSGDDFQTLDHTIDKGLWCVVGDDTNGYKFYNKSEGANKVLALNYIATGNNEGGNGRAKMVDASLSNATSQGDDQWLTTFNIHKNTTNNVGAFTISVKGLENYYINQRKPYLSFWIHSGANEEIGSSFYFYNVDSYTPEITEINTLKATFTNHVGGIFQPTQAEFEAFATSVANIPGTVTWDNLKTCLSMTSTAIATLKSQIDQHKPTVGQKYAIKNAYTNKYITPNVIPGSNLYVYLGNKVKSSVWIVESGDTEGTLKLKNAFSDLYASNATVNTDYSDLYIVSSGYGSDGAAGIGLTSDKNASQWYHANNDDHVIAYGFNAGASKWYFEAVSDDDFNSMNPNIETHINTLVNNAQDFLNAAPTEKATLRANPTYANYLAYKQKVKEGTDNQYVRLQCAKNGNNRFLGLNDGYTVGRALDASNQKTDLSYIWKLVPVESTGQYKLMNANTGTYLTGLTNATAGANNNAPTLGDFSNGYGFTFSLKNETNGNWDVIDGNGNKLNAETNGCINYWTADQNPGWYITKATDIEVALHALGDASYATVYLPYSISAVDGATAYVAESEATDNALVVRSTADGGFAANAGVVLVSDTKADKATLTLGENSNTSLLKGTNQPVSLTDDNRSSYLVFGPKDGATNTVGFWTPASTVTSLPANRAFYQATGGQAVSLVFDGNVTGISNALLGTDSAAMSKDAPVYDLSGRRVTKAVKGGIYIQNGKKYILK